jgi:hypothetical protein
VPAGLSRPHRSRRICRWPLRQSSPHRSRPTPGSCSRAECSTQTGGFRRWDRPASTVFRRSVFPPALHQQRDSLESHAGVPRESRPRTPDCVRHQIDSALRRHAIRTGPGVCNLLSDPHGAYRDIRWIFRRHSSGLRSTGSHDFQNFQFPDCSSRPWLFNTSE